MISKAEFKQTAGLSDALTDKWYGPITTAFGEYIPYSPLRMAHFLAQVGHESSGLTNLVESTNYSAEALRTGGRQKYFQTDAIAAQYARKPEPIANRMYANRMGNGTEASGDGWKHRGIGLIQLTGKNNQTACATALGILPVDKFIDLMKTDPDTAARASVWYFWSNGLVKWMDKDDVWSLSRAINIGSASSDGTPNGMDDRLARLARAKGVLL